MEEAPILGRADLLTVGSVAEELRVSTTTVHRLIRAGELRAHAQGAQYRITRHDLAAYLRRSSTAAPGA